MSIWDDIGGAISDAADAVAGVVEDVVNTVEEVVTDVVETIGNGIEDIVTWFGDLFSGIPVIGPIIAGFFEWIGDIVSGVLDLVASIVKGVLGIISGVIAGLIRMVVGGIGGLIEWDADVFVKGFGDIVSSVSGGVLIILGSVVSVVQAIFFLEWGERPLTDAERAILERVFRNSIAYYNIRVVEGFAGLFSINNRPFTLCNTIYMKNIDPAADPATLVHECTHVWQYQNQGARYTTDALWSQATLANAYSWQNDLADGATRWEQFNPEGQAAFIEDIYRRGRIVGMAATGNGEFYNDDPVGPNVEFFDGATNQTPLALDAVATVRGAWHWRVSGLF